MEAVLKNPNAVRSLSTIEGIRRLVESVHGADEVAAAIGHNPKQTEDDDVVALFRDIACKYGEAIYLAQLQQTPDCPNIASVTDYQRWVNELNEGSIKAKRLNQQLAARVDELELRLGRLGKGKL